jgi:hypothetical protein
MSIELSQEKAISLHEAAKLVPSSRRGKATHISRLIRWIVNGAKATDGSVVKLEALRLGGQWVTTGEALQRFAERLTSESEPSAPLRSPVSLRRAIEQADAELDALGV